LNGRLVEFGASRAVQAHRTAAAMGISLGYNQYGKAGVRLVHIDRSTPYTGSRT